MKRRDGLAGAENAEAVRLAPNRRSLCSFEHEIVGRVVHHGDLLEHDLPLELQIRVAQQSDETSKSPITSAASRRCSSSTRA